MAEENNLFRKKSLEALSKPSELDKFLKVTNPPLWISMGAIILLLAGVIVWGIFGTMDAKIDGVVTVKDGEIFCYVAADRGNSVKAGMPFTVCGVNAEVSEAEAEPIPAKEIDDYARFLGDFSADGYVYVFHGKLKDTGDIAALKNGSETCEIVVERVHAVTFLFSSEE